jgi:MFS family permease
LLATPVAAANNAAVLILGDLSRSLRVSTATASWLVTVFALALAVVTPLMATLLRRRGTRAALWLSAVLVAAGTVLVVASPWLPLTLAGRAGQAAGGAGMMALAMNLAGTARRMGVISAGFGMLGAVGPLLGQRLTDAVSWRAALAVLVVTLLAVPAVSRHTTKAPPAVSRFDSRGALLLALFSSGIVLLPSYPLPALAVAAVTAIVLAWHIRRRPGGYVPATALRSPLFTSSIAITFGLSVSYFTLLYAVPRLIGDRADWPAGAVATGQLVAMVVGSAVTLAFAALAARMGRGTVRAVLLTAGALAALAAVFAHGAAVLLIAIGLAVFSATAANGTQSLQAASAVPDHQRPTAIGLFTLVYLIGGALGPALATVLVLG